MRPARVRLVASTFLLVYALTVVAQQPKLTVAAAADLQHALAEITAGFEPATGAKVTVTYGSSGTLFMQIENGAPYDVFLSADADYPRRLVAAGRAERSSLYRYAVGRLVLWAPHGSPVDVGVGMNALLSPAVKRIAIANPRHAPYGRAALEAMRHAGVYEAVKDKLVMGENAVQAVQFVQSGNAQLGLVPRSLVFGFGPKGEGKYFEVPRESYAAIDQYAVTLTYSRKTRLSQQFIQYLKEPKARQVLEKNGFIEPVSAEPQRLGR